MSDNIIFIKSQTDEQYFKSLKKVQQSPEYIQNQKQIDCISKLLVEHADVPQMLIDWLIESVQENVALEYEASVFQKKTY